MQFDADLTKRFVCDELGCECPDEVFYSIKFDRHYQLEYQFYIDCALTIGDRLLVFVKSMERTKKGKKEKGKTKKKKDTNKKDKTEHAKDQEQAPELDAIGTLEKLVTYGLRMRSDNELNRFRLVLVSREPNKLEKELGDKFKKLIKNDSKAHLHIIDRKAMKGDYGFLLVKK